MRRTSVWKAGVVQGAAQTSRAAGGTLSTPSWEPLSTAWHLAARARRLYLGACVFHLR